MKPAVFGYQQASSLAEGLSVLVSSQGSAKILAGGQSLGPMMNLRLAQPELLLNFTHLDELRHVRESDTEVEIGAAITHAEIEDGKVPDPSAGLMRRVAGQIAYRAVRNRGTLGGSLAHADPAADWINLMPLLDAVYIAIGPHGVRSISAQDWMQGAFTTSLNDDEILQTISIPKLSVQARSSYYKINRKPGEFSEATAGFLVDPLRQICRGIIGALDGPPYYLADAAPLLSELQLGQSQEVMTTHLTDAGLEPASHSYQLHSVALVRAARALAKDHGAGR
jgi:carbon-monoxide dehydrogenase medium subunit